MITVKVEMGDGMKTAKVAELPGIETRDADGDVAFRTCQWAVLVKLGEMTEKGEAVPIELVRDAWVVLGAAARFAAATFSGDRAGTVTARRQIEACFTCEIVRK